MGGEGGILLRAMPAATLSFLLIRRGGDVEGGRAEQGTAHRTEDGTEAGAWVATQGDRAGRAGRGAQAACQCGGCAACRRGRATGARAFDRTRATRRAHR